MNGKPIEILVVEDREDDIIALRKVLGDARIVNPLKVVGTGQEALDWVFQRPSAGLKPGDGPPDLVILDLGLPDMSGLEVLRRIRGEERFKDLPVLVLTISDHDEDIIRSYDLGVRAFIQKPVRLQSIQDYFIGESNYALVITRLPEEDVQ